MTFEFSVEDWNNHWKGHEGERDTVWCSDCGATYPASNPCKHTKEEALVPIPEEKEEHGLDDLYATVQKIEQDIRELRAAICELTVDMQSIKQYGRPRP